MTFLPQTSFARYVPSKIMHLQAIQTKYINLFDDKTKDLRMQQLLKDFKYASRHEATKLDNQILALSYSHYRALSSMEAPCIILEDDCIEYDFKDTVAIPADADILFLGAWKNIPKPFKSGKYVPAYEKVSEDVVRAYSMLGSHAIMYVSDKGREVALKAYEMAIKTEVWNDVMLSRTLPFLNAYALVKPVFGQTSMYQESMVDLDQVLVGEDVPIGTPGDL